MNTNTVITTEECEACSTSKEFTVDDLYNYDLYRSVVVSDNTVYINYEGEWTCTCGHDNSTLGKAAAL
jgi:hypothetical protein